MNRGRRGEDIFSEEDEVSKKLSGVKWPVCLGPQTFIDRIKEKYGSGKINKEIPSSREMLPDRERIIAEICRFYDVKDTDMIEKRCGRSNEFRNAAIPLTKNLRLDTYSEIGRLFGINNDRTVRSVFVCMKVTLTEDKRLAPKMEKLQGSQDSIKKVKNGLDPFVVVQDSIKKVKNGLDPFVRIQ